MTAKGPANGRFRHGRSRGGGLQVRNHSLHGAVAV
jgi:hypothetical protein